MKKTTNEFVSWKIDDAEDLPLAVIEDTPDGNGVMEIGKRTARNVEMANRIIADHNAEQSRI